MATLSRSYAGGGDAKGDWSWLLFVRQRQPDAFVLAAVAHAGDVRALFELQLDKHGLRDHINELGIEVGVSAFTTLGDRASVGVVVEHSANGLPQSVRVVLTYAFGASISRTGRLELPLVASDVPTHVIALLSDLHATPITPTLSETQKYAKEAAWSASARPLPVPVSSDATTRSHDPTNLIGEGGPDASTSTHSQVLKRRLVPSGIVRRKGPKGAKLAKS